MAVIALVAGWNMIDRLAECALIVVAGVAASKHLEMIHSYYRRPRGRAMAGFAAFGNNVVCRRGCCCAHSSRIGVAAGTVCRRADEHAVNVTTRAFAELMRAVEPKSGRKMIELRSDRSL